MALTYRSRESAALAAVDAARGWGVRAAAHQLDLTSAEECAAAVDAVAAAYGGLHTLVHAAGPHVPMRHLSAVDPAAMDALCSLRRASRAGRGDEQGA